MFLSDTTTVGNYIAFDMGKTVTFKLIILVFEDKNKFLNYEVSLLSGQIGPLISVIFFNQLIIYLINKNNKSLV